MRRGVRILRRTKTSTTSTTTRTSVPTRHESLCRPKPWTLTDVLNSKTDDDGDGIKNHVDDCPNTPEGELIDAVGSGGAGSTYDSDGIDGVNDAEDAFKFDANESGRHGQRRCGGPVGCDAFPEDPMVTGGATSQAEVEEGGNGVLYAVIALLMVGLLGGGGYFYTSTQTRHRIRVRSPRFPAARTWRPNRTWAVATRTLDYLFHLWITLNLSSGTGKRRPLVSRRQRSTVVLRRQLRWSMGAVPPGLNSGRPCGELAVVDGKTTSPTISSNQRRRSQQGFFDVR